MRINKPNRRITMVVLIMFITITFASFNTNLFIDGRAYVRAEDLVRITNIELIDATEQAFETYNPEYTADTITLNANLPKQNSTAQYRITITNNSDYDYDVQNIVEQKYSNTNISYEIVGLVKDSTVLEAHTSSTFLLNLSNNTTINEEEDVYQTKSYGFEYTGGEQEFVAPFDGEYNIELWGAEGSDRNMNVTHPGKGAYTSGKIQLKKNQTLYVYVGQQNRAMNVASFNGSEKSTAGGGPGGGATDIRLVKGKEWKEFNSLKTRIMVAAGGGSDAGNTDYYSGSGGGLVGYGTAGANGSCQTPGTQFAGGTENCSGYYPKSNGFFGRGSYMGGGGGSGWFGGAGGYHSYGGGTGGSSFISGHPGCVSITSESSEKNITFVNDSNGIACNSTSSSGYNSNGYNMNSACNKHYSGKVFTETVMIDGNGYVWDENGKAQTSTGMPTHDGTSTMTGNSGNGYAKITFNRKIEDGSDYDFKYTGGQQTLTVPYTGIYKLETWGAQGGTQGNGSTRNGFGGYSTGKIKLSKDDTLYINVGGEGKAFCDVEDGTRVYFTGGYNGGGAGSTWVDNKCGGSGGGATHIATTSGQLFELEENKDSILIVSGGGGGFNGGVAVNYGSGGAGGGYIGNDGTTKDGNYFGTGGTQTQGGINFNQYVTNRFSHDGLFGLGGSSLTIEQYPEGGNISGGGGGYYGGGGGCGNGGFAGGGSGYIGNDSLFEKVMYCFNCQESQDFETKTVTTTSHSKEPKQNIPKEGNGYSRITLVQRQSNSIELSLKFYIKRLPDYDITYNLNGGSISGEKVTYTRNTDTFTLPTPTKDGYTFTGWSGGKNLFDKDNVEVINAYISPELTEITESNYNRLFIMPIEANTTYVVSKLKGAQLQLAYTESHPSVGTEALGQTGFHATIYNYNDTTRHYITITTGETAKYLVCRFNQTAQDTYTTQQLMDSIQVEIGTKPTAYESYINSANVTVQKGSRGNRVYTANWQPITFNISYELDGGTISNPPTTYNPESSTLSIPNPTRTGYTFTGWTGGKNLVGSISDWEKNDIAIATGQNKENQAYIRTKGYIKVKPNTTYYFSQNGNYCSNIHQYNSNKEVISSDISTLTCNSRSFTTTENTYYLRISLRQDPALTSITTGHLSTGQIQLEEGTVRTSYEPYLSTETSNIEIQTGSTGNRHYVANWEAIDYTIEYDLDGGTISNQPTTYNPETETFTLPTPTKAGYEFLGWTQGKNLVNYNNLSAAAISKDVNVDSNGFVSDSTPTTDARAWGYSNSNWYASLDSGTYTVTLYFSQQCTNSVDSAINIYQSSGSNIKGKSNLSNIDKYSTTFTINSQRDISIFVKAYDGVFRIQLEKGNTSTEWEPYISTPQSITITKGSAGNRIYHAVWRDNSTPTLSLAKDTYIEGFNGWTLDNAYVDGNNVLILGENGESAATSAFYVTNGAKWYPEYEFMPTTETSYFSPNGGVRNGLRYYDASNHRTNSSQNATENGVAIGGKINQWTSSLTDARYTSRIHGHGGEINNVEIIFGVTPDSTYSKPTVKVRNFKMHCEDMPNSFYDILITSSDNVGVTTTKYAAGSQIVNYFKTNGTVVNGNSIRVTSNGIYTVYVEDAAGNGKVEEIEITRIQ